MYPVNPSIFSDNPFQWSWYETDYLFTPDGTREMPNHHCKQTWTASLPFITRKRNAVDIGCRDGEYTRYLHKDFNHVYCFDYRRRKLFHKNVDLKKITHFKCALGDKNKVIKVSGAGSIDSGKIPKDKWYDEEIFTLDQFNLTDIDYIKIDVDGYEQNVLKGAINTIKRNLPLLIIEAENGDLRGINFCEKELDYIVVAWDQEKRNAILKKY
jgi:FkbM family methyltransferase